MTAHAARPFGTAMRVHGWYSTVPHVLVEYHANGLRYVCQKSGSGVVFGNCGRFFSLFISI